MAASLSGRKEDQQPPVAYAGGTGQTVSVACKVPMGLVLRVHGTMEVSEQTTNGPRLTKVFPVLKEYTVKGPSHPVNRLAKAPIAGGYAITRGIPKDFWDKWLADNRESPLVVNHQIFAADTPTYVAGQAKEMREIRSGMEPMNPNGKDSRIPKPTRPEAGKIENDADASMDFAEVED